MTHNQAVSFAGGRNCCTITRRRRSWCNVTHHPAVHLPHCPSHSSNSHWRPLTGKLHSYTQLHSSDANCSAQLAPICTASTPSSDALPLEPSPVAGPDRDKLPKLPAAARSTAGPFCALLSLLLLRTPLMLLVLLPLVLRRPALLPLLLPAVSWLIARVAPAVLSVSMM